jgi:hypothetical protein
MSTRMMHELRSLNRGDGRPGHEPPCIGCERVTLNNVWSEALPFLYLVAISGIIVYLATRI